MEYGYKEPVYIISIVAKSLKVRPATLRSWEKKGLIKPTRLGRNRFYSKCDVDRLEYIKELTQKKRMDIVGVKNVLSATRCWEAKRCKPKERDTCEVYQRYGNA